MDAILTSYTVNQFQRETTPKHEYWTGANSISQQALIK